ncbi:MAG: hypothetical protein ACFN9G_06535 [Cardiobacterium sp.]
MQRKSGTARYHRKCLACRRKRKIDDPELFTLVKDRFLKLHWSPEQIQYRLRHENNPHSSATRQHLRRMFQRS